MKSIILILFIVCQIEVFGGCGLENCKNPSTLKRSKNLFAIELDNRFSNFTFEDMNGYIEEISLRISFYHQDNWLIDFKVPYIALQYDHEETDGFSNPILGFEKWFALESFSPLIGIQFEVPLGEDRKGVAADHFEMLPFVGLGYRIDNYTFRLIVGYRFSLNDSSEEDSTVTPKKYHSEEPVAVETIEDVGHAFINYHAEEEAQIFLTAGRRFIQDKLFAGLQSTFRQVIVGDDNLFLMYGGPTIEFSATYFKIQSQFNLPFSEDKKMNWSIALNFIVEF